MTVRAAVLTDVHANVQALTAALAAIKREACDVIYSLGDVIGIGPAPRECLETLLSAPKVRFVMGNHDALFAFGFPDPRPEWLDDAELFHQQWTHAQLNPDLRQKVAAWPWRREEMVGSLGVTFLHYPIDGETNEFQPIIDQPAIAQLDGLFADCRTPLVFYGHHHPPADSTGRSRFVNPGSLGCSPDSVARFAILTVENDTSWHIEHRAVPYDRSDLFRQFEERSVPERAMILAAFFGQPPE